MLPAIVDALACPVCQATVQEGTGSLRCPRGHAYDIAKHGFVTLRPGSGPQHGGDDAAMVAARDELLASGVYDGLADRITSAAADAYPGSGIVVDAGGGTGFYLARVLAGLAATGAMQARPTALRAGPARAEVLGGSGSGIGAGPAAAHDPRSTDTRAQPAGLVLDASPYALRRAAHVHREIGAVGADIWMRWPVRDAVAGLVLGVFAPRNGAEMQRVLRSDGALILVTPGPRHLVELVGALELLRVDPQKETRVGRSLVSYFDRRAVDLFEERLELDRATVSALVRMGPSARHLAAGDFSDRIGALPERVGVTLSAAVMTWRPRTE